MRILVIDNEMIKPSYIEDLEKNPQVEEVTYTTKGLEGLQYLGTGKYDVLILDVILTNVDGYEIMRIVRGDKKYNMLKIFIVTNMFSSFGIRLAFDFGADYYMLKPINGNILMERVLNNTKKIQWTENTYYEKECFPKNDVESLLIVDILRDIGVPSHTNGYRYIKRALEKFMEDRDTYHYGITKVLYPSIAKEFGSTASRVERCIRHAIESAWSRGSLEKIEEVFGATVSSLKGKPTNYEFLSGICEYIKTYR